MNHTNIMNNVYGNVIKKFDVGTLYRYQGNNINGSSLKHLVIDRKNLNVTMNIDGSIYFSKSYDHHKYFVRKRLKQEINKLLNEDNLPIISQRNIRVTNHYNIIKQHIINNHYNFKGESIRLILSNNILTLIRDNSMKQEEKTKVSNVPELSDRRKYGGAYGLSSDWLDLVHNSALFYSQLDIYYDDILNYLYKTRLNFTTGQKTDITDFLELKQPFTHINNELYSPYHKYVILEKIERIIDNKNYLENSQLAKHPTKTIKEILNEYKMLREFMLNNLEKEYDNKILRLKS